MNLERATLLADLDKFVERGNGVLVGAPGVGKSNTLRRLSEQYASQQRLHLLLPIDQLGDGTMTDLQTQLGFDHDLVETLKEQAIATGDRHAVLLVDSFDAARGEQVQRRFLHLIQRAVNELGDSWRVLVSVRTYDARKSHELLDLIGAHVLDDSSDYTDQRIRCRHFAVPRLTLDEVEAGLKQISIAQDRFAAMSLEFRELLRTPFNLWLLERVTTGAGEIPELGHVRSEVQLLGLFWARRVGEHADRESRLHLLERMVRAMVDSHALSVRSSTIFDSSLASAWQGLLSDELLVELPTGQRVAFSHNILFDYAVSILLIDNDPSQLPEFLRDDRSRALFLRPSLNYYFTRLWHDQRDTFWQAFWGLLGEDDPELRLTARLLPPATVVEEARAMTDLDPILQARRSGKSDGVPAAQAVLQALRVLGVPRDELWIPWIQRILERPDRAYVWDAVVIASEALARTTPADGSVVDACGQLARRAVEWVWQNRIGDGSVDALGAHWVLPLILATFGTDRVDSRRAVEKILALLDERDFPIEYFMALTDRIDRIWPHDAELVAEVFETLFRYRETSDRRVHVGSYVVPLTISRQQDYELARYRLVQHFSEFLEAAPVIASRTAIRTVNQVGLDEHVAPHHLREGRSVEHDTKWFPFRGATARLLPDASHIWAGSGPPGRPIRMAEHVSQWLVDHSSIEEDRPDLSSILNLFRDEALLAVWWAQLLGVGAQAPSALAATMFELCVARPVQTARETRLALGAFLDAGWAHFSVEQRSALEQSIMSLPGESTDPEVKAHLENLRGRLLARIPTAQLVTLAARELRSALEEEGRLPGNEPLATFSGWSVDYGIDPWLQGQGVDLDAPALRALREASKPLEEFVTAHSNAIPDLTTVESILPVAISMLGQLRISTVAAALAEGSWTTLADTAYTIARAPLDPRTQAFSFCREVLLNACRRRPLTPNTPESEERFTSPMWSPSPRTAAAQGLPWLLEQQRDEEVLEAVQLLTRDGEPAVRYLAIRESWRLILTMQDEFWNLIVDRARNETNLVVLRAVCLSVARVLPDEHASARERLALAVLAEIAPRLMGAGAGHDDSSILVEIAVWLLIDRGTPWASSFIDDIVDRSVERHHQLLQATVATLKFVTPRTTSSPASERYIGQALTVVGRFVAAAISALGELLAPRATSAELAEPDLAVARTLNAVPEAVVRHLYAPTTGQEEEEQVKEERQYDSARFYFMIKPLIEQLLDSLVRTRRSYIAASTSHYLMELLHRSLAHDPVAILRMAADLSVASQSGGYHLDPMAAQEVVELVEEALADHRVAIRGGRGLSDLLRLLNVFAASGSPDALRLIWRLDEVFR